MKRLADKAVFFAYMALLALTLILHNWLRGQPLLGPDDDRDVEGDQAESPEYTTLDELLD